MSTQNTGLVFKLITDNSKFSNGLKSASNQLNSFNNNIGKIGGAIGAAFSVATLFQFTKEAVQIASTAEAIERAFNRIGGNRYLQDLQAATKGTVSDLELMKQTVRASNFDIPLNTLASLFTFARRRAEETGQSVDYLVESIILGIGRKSPLILDNLGISAIKLKEKLNGVSSETASIGDVAQAVGSIAREELAKMGTEADNTSQKTGKIAASWEDIKLGIGKVIIESVAFQSALDLIGGSLDNIKNKDIIQEADGFLRFTNGNYDTTNLESISKAVSDIEKLMAGLNTKYNSPWEKIFKAGDANKARELNDQLRITYNYYRNLQDNFVEAPKKDDSTPVGIIASLNAKLKEYKESLDNATSEDKIAYYNKEIRLLEEKLKRYNELGQPGKGILGKINDQIKEYNDQLNLANSEKEIMLLQRKISLKEMELEHYKSLTTAIKKLNQVEAKPQIKTSAGKMSIAGTKSNYTAADIYNGKDEKLFSTDELRSAAEEANQIISNFQNNFVSTTAEAFGQMLAGGDFGLDKFFETIIRSVANFATEYGKQLVALGLAKLAFDKMFLVPGGAALAIAAGMALMAAGSYINARFAKGPSIPALATGTNYIPQDGPYYLHKGESVVPKKYNNQQGSFAPIVLDTRISGRDILLVSNRESYYNSRISGR